MIADGSGQQGWRGRCAGSVQTIVKTRPQSPWSSPYLHRGRLQGAERAGVPGRALADMLQAASEPEAEVEDTL